MFTLICFVINFLDCPCDYFNLFKSGSYDVPF